MDPMGVSLLTEHLLLNWKWSKEQTEIVWFLPYNYEGIKWLEWTASSVLILTWRGASEITNHEEVVKLRVRLATPFQRLLAHLKEVNKWRVDSQELIGLHMQKKEYQQLSLNSNANSTVLRGREEESEKNQ